MTQEEKQILIKVLCAGLPYEEKVEVCIKDKDIKSIDCVKYNTIGTYIGLLDEEKFSVKPYLRPMSSMTEKERISFFKATNFHIALKPNGFFPLNNQCSGEHVIEALDWFNKHMFDYRGLIEKGLALEAPEGMY